MSCARAADRGEGRGGATAAVDRCPNFWQCSHVFHVAALLTGVRGMHIYFSSFEKSHEKSGIKDIFAKKKKHNHALRATGYHHHHRHVRAKISRAFTEELRTRPPVRLYLDVSDSDGIAIPGSSSRLIKNALPLHPIDRDHSAHKRQQQRLYC